MNDNTSLGSLLCTVCTEELALSGEVRKKTISKNVQLLIGRNEFRDVVLRIELSKTSLVYRVQDLTIFKKFAREGKATIKLAKQRIQFLLSNCPPDKLIMFLKLFTTKVECQNITGVVSERKRLFSNVSKEFTDISPLNMKELQTLRNARAEKSENSAGFTPKGKALKRKRELDDNKENLNSKQFKPHTLTNGRAVSRLGLGGVPKTLLGAGAGASLSAEQQRVLNVVLSGKSVFFTGSAGTGKSFLLKRIIGALAPQHTFATASTGVAACHIGGTTLHAFAGIGSGVASLEQCVELAMRPQVAQNWRRCRHLIIDEISMVDAQMFDKLEVVARMVRGNSDPFGGIQLILCGDFLQLPPVTKGNNANVRKFAFQTAAWRRCIERCMQLTTVRRQRDATFIRLLNNVRVGRCTPEVSAALSATADNHISRDGILATRLCTHKEDVDQINRHRLQKLTGKKHVFESSDSAGAVTSSLDHLCPVTSRLTLVVGAQVMLTKNVDVQRGLVNGARGVVTGFQSDACGYPLVKFLCAAEQKVPVTPEKWVFKLSGGGGQYMSRKQLPLKLAWAISIHKSQGMSLDCVEMSLARVFECGQAYVALSRATSLQGLRVLDFDRSCVKADPTVLKFYQQLHVIDDNAMTSSPSSSSQQSLSSQARSEPVLDHW